MTIREQIEQIPFIENRQGYYIGLIKAADLAEARERELLAENIELRNKALFIETEYRIDITKLKAGSAKMIAELRDFAIDYNLLESFEAIINRHGEPK